MNPVDLHSRYVTALRNQKRGDVPSARVLPCPFPGHHHRTFQGIEQLYIHAKDEHGPEIDKLDPQMVRVRLREQALKLKKSDQSSEATAGDRSTPDITGLTLESDTHMRQPSPPSSKKRPAESEHLGRRGKAQSYTEVTDSPVHFNQTTRIAPDQSRSKHQDPRLYDPGKAPKGTPSSHQIAPNPSHEWSNEATKSSQFQNAQPQSSLRQATQRAALNAQTPQRQPGLIELQKYDPRYPGLLLQPDSRPISQEQLASEVKSIYAGLTMVETKCIHVDRNQAAQDNPEIKLAADHWQALIALHRTLLHEHHDFFLASQHPSASPALQRLAAKYSMPARMWKHGIHSFLELLRRRLPESIDFMLAFIYLAYQMMALLYETVPAFEDTWIECLGDLGRYRMAIEDEDLRDRETWAGVARSWYTKAADKNPTVGRLYHHLAILARPNALQQLYYYTRSLTCVKPFLSARESILTLLDPILGRVAATYSHALPIDTSFIKTHAIMFEQLPRESLVASKQEFLGNLDNHIGRVTAKWKEQGVYIAVTNVAAWFQYGIDSNALRQVFLTQLLDSTKDALPTTEAHRTTALADQQESVQPSIERSMLEEEIETLKGSDNFQDARSLTNDTFALVLRRIGDKNVLPHVHIILSFLTVFASSTSYVSVLIDNTPWADLVSFLNTLIKTENQLQSQSQGQTQDINTLLSTAIFPDVGERVDELPLPEDYLIRGLVWSQGYLPKNWFEREHGEEERYLEHASTIRVRIERVLRLGFQVAQHKRWIAYDSFYHTFSVLPTTSVTTS